MINAPQLRAARGFLNWSRGRCAMEAQVSIETVKNLETGRFRPNAETTEKLTATFAKNGIKFVDNGIQKIGTCPHCSGVIS